MSLIAPESPAVPALPILPIAHALLTRRPARVPPRAWRPAGRRLTANLDEAAPFATRAVEGVDEVPSQRGRLLVARLRLQPGQRVLDLGCGAGALGAWTAEQVARGGEVIGIDPQPLRVALAARRHPRFVAHLGLPYELSNWPERSFDAVYLDGVYDGLAPALQQRTLEEALRVLRRGGRLALNAADPSRPSDAERLVGEALQTLVDADRVPATLIDRVGVPHPVHRAGLEAALRTLGFEAVRVVPETYVDIVRDADDVIAAARSGAAGRWLHELGPGLRAVLREQLAPRLEAWRSEGLLLLHRHVIVADARRPC